MASVKDYLFGTAQAVAEDPALPWSAFSGKTFVVTGATGLIASQLVRVLIARNEYFGSQIKIILPVRNEAKAKRLFGDREEIQLVEWLLGQNLAIDGDADYFVHAACGTSSKSFSVNPATTINQIVGGGAETLDASNRLGVEKYLLLSTMEVYGEVSGMATEGNLGCLDPMIVRNSYPEAKTLLECLCASYCAEYKTPAAVVRLAQTFGQGVDPDDMRVFADFGRHALSGSDIVLLSDGLKRNSYLSVDDAVRAILVLLVNGVPGEAYNAANEGTYCSIKEMADTVLAAFGAKGAKVVREIDIERAATFRKGSDLRLDTSKLKSLGWRPNDSLLDMYKLMIDCWRCR